MKGDVYQPPTIILVQTQLAENIGATARAMMNFGLRDLRLVNPLQDWKSKPARSMAAGADALLESATIYTSTEEAIHDIQVVYATTARPRDMTKIVTTPAEACQDLVNYTRNSVKTGLLFGREKCGLTNDDIALVDKVVEIPVNPEFSSLNLSQAVVVMAYQWFQASQAIPETSLRHNPETCPANREELVNFFNRLEAQLDVNGFLAIPGKRDIMVRNIRNMFNRTQLTEQEIRTLHGIVSSLVLYSTDQS